MSELTNDQLRRKIFDLINDIEECLHELNSTKYMVRLISDLRDYTKTLFERLENDA